MTDKPFSMALRYSDLEALRVAFRQAREGIKVGDRWGRIMSAGEVIGTWSLDHAYAEARSLEHKKNISGDSPPCPD